MVKGFATHRNFVFGLTHFSEGLDVSIRNENAVPLEAPWANRRRWHCSFNGTFEQANLAPITIAEYRLRHYSRISEARDEVDEAIRLQLVPKDLSQSCR